MDFSIMYYFLHVYTTVILYITIILCRVHNSDFNLVFIFYRRRKKGTKIHYDRVGERIRQQFHQIPEGSNQTRKSTADELSKMLRIFGKSHMTDEFLTKQQKSDQEEALEVAIQCLDSVYNGEQSDADNTSDPLSQIDLFQLFLTSVSSSPEKKEQGETLQVHWYNSEL